MPHKFRNRYRIPSARLPHWDYAENGAYFITICTAQRIPFFGMVTNGTMQLSEIGRIAHDCWAEIPHHFPFVELGEFVIMPNHMHGIVIINNNYNSDDNCRDAIHRVCTRNNDNRCRDAIHRVCTRNNDNRCRDAIHRVCTGNNDDRCRDAIHRVCTGNNDDRCRDAINRVCTGNENGGGITGNQNPMFHENISRIIRWYKGRVTFDSRKIHENFAWQSRFYDHIIRNQKSFDRIETYIRNNPLLWINDTYYAT